MVRQVGVWRISDGAPRKVLASDVDIEQQLEAWIESDPGILETGLKIIGRQVRTEAGPLDLLAIDPQGRLVVVELKRGTLYRETLAQALDYAACIKAMSEEELQELKTDYLRHKPQEDSRESTVGDLPDGDEGERELRVCLVGTDRDANLDRLVAFLSSQYGIPITVVTFEVYQLHDGDRILVRQFAESEPPPPPPRTVEELCAQADIKDIGPQFRSVIGAAKRHNLYLKPWKKSVVAASQANWARGLFTVWPEPNKSDKMYVSLGPEVFARFYPPLTAEEIIAELGEEEDREMTNDQATEFAACLQRLFARVQHPSLTELGQIADSNRQDAWLAIRELDGLAEQAHIDPDGFETWAEVADVVEKLGIDATPSSPIQAFDPSPIHISDD